ncbi:prolipoprotein diacylglyceryl transferase [Leeuwenhoekiella polynyae]|uniref:Phosphatidylglycerol--prolipoprotein diacylglyceryl transferase n=1 Tax=Leeuwenhoekiella polynyae TaxID=1550906 RepID=A0A4Q0NTX6_9FLAO|nr:prolipoprotein diacylglyceryl transferase [Leeuwenhoekiella polynyae]RXG14462.1 prolipoprotein diacylglyceryl transferase [Leeuwenhoekiella polynyae]
MLPLKMTWNPSTGLDLGFLTLHYYSLMFVIAFSLGWYLMKKVYKNEGVEEEKLDPLFIYSVLAILIGARLGHVFFYQTELLWQDPLSVFLPFRFVPEIEYTGFQGLASHGAAIGMIFAMYLYNKKILKKSVLWLLDRVILPVSLGAIFVRIGNFFNSEMVGKVTESNLGIKFVQDQYNKYEVQRLTGIPNEHKAYSALTDDPQFANYIAEIPYRFPGQLMESFGYIFVFLILMFVYWKTGLRKKEGFLFGLFLVLLWTVRFIVEYFKRAQVEGREDWIFGFNTGQILSIPFILIGIFMIVRALGQKKEPQY